jgi:hypothetical protein
MTKESIINRPHIDKHVTHERIGPNPKLMYISGIHGNEGIVGRLLKTWLNRLWKECPEQYSDNIRVVEANPDALKKDKRSVGIPDMNREFREGGRNYWAVQEIKEILTLFPNIEYVFSFHEETDKFGYRDKINGKGIERFPRNPNSFYLYDAYDREKPHLDINFILNSLKTELVNHNFTLYSGYDDHKKWKKETVQLNKVENGYCFQDPQSEKFNDGTFENWVVGEGLQNRNKVKRSFVFEIPSYLSEEKKALMIEIILKKFIIPYLNQVYNLNFPEQKILS